MYKMLKYLLKDQLENMIYSIHIDFNINIINSDLQLYFATQLTPSSNKLPYIIQLSTRSINSNDHCKCGYAQKA